MEVGRGRSRCRRTVYGLGEQTVGGSGAAGSQALNRWCCRGNCLRLHSEHERLSHQPPRLCVWSPRHFSSPRALQYLQLSHDRANNDVNECKRERGDRCIHWRRKSGRIAILIPHPTCMILANRSDEHCNSFYTERDGVVERVLKYHGTMQSEQVREDFRGRCDFLR